MADSYEFVQSYSYILARFAFASVMLGDDLQFGLLKIIICDCMIHNIQSRMYKPPGKIVTNS